MRSFVRKCPISGSYYYITKIKQVVNKTYFVRLRGKEMRESL